MLDVPEGPAFDDVLPIPACSDIRTEEAPPGPRLTRGSSPEVPPGPAATQALAAPRHAITIAQAGRRDILREQRPLARRAG